MSSSFPTLNLTEIAQRMSDTLQLVVDSTPLNFTGMSRQMAARSCYVECSAARRQAKGSSEQVIKLFSTIRGSGWPNLNTRINGVESWPSATANGTE